MDINATIIGQFLTFAILVWFTMKYVWPPIIQSLHEREKKIIAGLEASERSRQELEVAEKKAITMIQEARIQASHILDQANFHSAQLVEEAKHNAKLESIRIIELAQDEIDREVNKAKEVLKTQLATLAIANAEKVLKRHINPSLHHDLLNQLITEI